MSHRCKKTVTENELKVLITNGNSNSVILVKSNTSVCSNSKKSSWSNEKVQR